MRATTSTSEPGVKQYLAHVRQDDEGSFVVHELEEHLRAAGDIVDTKGLR